MSALTLAVTLYEIMRRFFRLFNGLQLHGN